MTINGKIGEFKRDEERARGAGHDPVIVAKALMAAQGILPVGTLLTEHPAGCAPVKNITGEVIGTGDGTTQIFFLKFAETEPIERKSVRVTIGSLVYIDDGRHSLWRFGAATAESPVGWVRYEAGWIELYFDTAPANGTPIVANYMTEVSAVLDEAVDTAVSGSGLCIVHGSVQADVLKIQSGTDFVAVDAAMMKRLSGKGIYPA